MSSLAPPSGGPDSFTYRAQKKASFESLQAAKKGKTTAERIRLLVEGSDVAAQFAWRNISETARYIATVAAGLEDVAVFAIHDPGAVEPVQEFHRQVLKGPGRPAPGSPLSSAA